MARRGGVARYDLPSAPADIALAGKLLIARLSVTVTIHHLAHGGAASAGRVATFPKPVELMEAALPRFPAGVTTVRARRGAKAGLASKKNGLYAVRREKVLDAMRWLKGHNPYYADVVAGPLRFADSVDGGEIDCVRDLDPKAGFPPDDKGPSTDQVGPAVEVSEAEFETGIMLPPEVATAYMGEVEKFLETARLQTAEWGKHFEAPRPSVAPSPVPESRTRGFLFVSPHGYFLATGAF